MRANALIAMRLAEMSRVHPEQDNSRVCSRCGEVVGIYPSGQRALKRDPSLEIICATCLQPPFGDINIPAADSLDEMLAETRASVDVKKAPD